MTMTQCANHAGRSRHLAYAGDSDNIHFSFTAEGLYETVMRLCADGISAHLAVRE